MGRRTRRRRSRFGEDAAGLRFEDRSCRSVNRVRTATGSYSFHRTASRVSASWSGAGPDGPEQEVEVRHLSFALARGVMAAQGFLVPLVQVRILAG